MLPAAKLARIPIAYLIDLHGEAEVPQVESSTPAGEGEGEMRSVKWLYLMPESTYTARRLSSTVRERLRHLCR